MRHLANGDAYVRRGTWAFSDSALSLVNDLNSIIAPLLASTLLPRMALPHHCLCVLRDLSSCFTKGTTACYSDVWRWLKECCPLPFKLTSLFLWRVPIVLWAQLCSLVHDVAGSARTFLAWALEPPIFFRRVPVPLKENGFQSQVCREIISLNYKS